MRFAIVLGFICSLFMPFPASARTWNVRQDGTGDYSVIQEAVDVAEEGDTIDIGPGWYTEYGTYNNGFGWFDSYVDVNVDNLTFVGAGPDLTIIGPSDINDHEFASYGMGNNSDFTLHISGIRFVNFNAMGIYHHFGYLGIDNCVFEDSRMGFSGHLSRGGVITNCISRSISSTAFSLRSSSNGIIIKDSQFFSCDEGIRFDGCNGGQVIDCEFSGGAIPCAFYEGSSGEIRGCTMSDYGIYGVGFSGNNFVSMTENVIQSDMAEASVIISTAGNLFISDNIFYGGNYTLSFLNAPQNNFQFHNNHILRESGEYIYTPNYYGPNHHLDLTNNYWGTTDVEEIAAHIIDGRVLPNSNFIVDFEPIAGGPVPTKNTTLDGLKALYR